MKKTTEKRLRGPFLILLLAIGGLVVLVGGIALSGSVNAGLAATTFFGIISVLGVFYGVYRDFLEPAEAAHSAEVSPETSGTRPDEEYSGLEITEEDIEASQLTPEQLAKLLMSSPNWKSAGKGDYLPWWRKRLKQIFLSERISLQTFEISLMALTLGSTILLFLVFFSMVHLPGEASIWYIDIASSVYPDTLSSEIDALVSLVSFVVTAIGLRYFSFKQWSTCPACGNHFALRSLGRYYKPQHQHKEQRKEGNQVATYLVTEGVHIFKCEDCGRWSVFDEQWEEQLS